MTFSWILLKCIPENFEMLPYLVHQVYRAAKPSLADTVFEIFPCLADQPDWAQRPRSVDTGSEMFPYLADQPDWVARPRSVDTGFEVFPYLADQPDWAATPSLAGTGPEMFPYLADWAARPRPVDWFWDVPLPGWPARLSSKAQTCWLVLRCSLTWLTSQTEQQGPVLLTLVFIQGKMQWLSFHGFSLLPTGIEPRYQAETIPITYSNRLGQITYWVLTSFNLWQNHLFAFDAPCLIFTKHGIPLLLR